MQKTTSSFQIIFIGVFIFAAVVGVIIFSVSTNSAINSTAKATIWGTEPAEYFNNLLAKVDPQKKDMDVTYVQKNPDTFEAEFTNALAEGRGPDIVLIDDSKILSWRAKLFPIPYSNLPQRTFTDTFIDSASIFLRPDGIYAMPLYVDPLTMYWNKTMFNDAGIPIPPKTWQELTNDIPKLNQVTDRSEIIKSAVALGESSNIDHSKEIFVNLLLQGGDNLVSYDANKGQFDSILNSASIGGESVLGQTLNFYTSFSNPKSDRYSWNKSIVRSRDLFIAGNLAMYFGYASEYPVLQRKNPNLDFDVTTMPQTAGRSATSYAKINALAIVKQSKNVPAAFNVITKLVAASAQKELTKITNLPSPRRDLLAVSNNTSLYSNTFAKATIQSKTWYDPNPVATGSLFKNLIDTVTTGEAESSQAMNIADQKLKYLVAGGNPNNLK